MSGLGVARYAREFQEKTSGGDQIGLEIDMWRPERCGSREIKIVYNATTVGSHREGLGLEQKTKGPVKRRGGCKRPATVRQNCMDEKSEAAVDL